MVDDNRRADITSLGDCRSRLHQQGSLSGPEEPAQEAGMEGSWWLHRMLALR